MNKNCEACEFIQKPARLILQTKYWNVELGPNQAYLGRAYVTLRTHKGSLSELDADEWTDFQALVQKLERAYREAFGADPLNWACLMNNAYQEEAANPHVHWHIFPRYKQAPTVGGVTFDDPNFAHHYDPKAERLADNATLGQVTKTLQKHL